MKKENNILTSAKIMAQSMHELNPARTPDEWEKHILENAHDPKKFFGANTVGLSEYEAFVRSHDADTYKRNLRMKERNRQHA